MSFENDDQLLEELKGNSGVLHLYNKYTTLKKARDEYIGACPIHNERTGSFTVYLHDKVWLWKCFGCDRRGNIFQLVEEMEHVPFKDAVTRVREFLGQTWHGQKQRVEKVFKPFVPDATKNYKTYPLTDFARYETNLANSSEAIEWLLGRGIKYETAKELHTGFRQDVGQMAGEDNMDIANKGWIAFPSIKDDKVVSIKYRSIVRKAFCRQPGMATELYNIPDIDPLETLYVVEGEPDAHVLKQAGFHVVSLPSGSVKITPAMKDILRTADQVILAGDNDGGVGNKIMDALWKELRERTYLLKWPEGKKDANQTFLESCAGDTDRFREIVEKLTHVAKSRPIPGVYNLQEVMLSAEHTALVDHPERLHFPWPKVDSMMILLPGSVLVIGATNTGMGKTQFTMNTTLYGAREHGETILNYQCELSPEEFSNIVAAHVLRRDRNFLTPDEVKSAAHVIGSIQYYIGHDGNLTKAGEVLDLIEAAIRILGATTVVLDHIHFICRNEENEVQAQANAMQRIKQMSQKYGCKFIVLTQPRKAKQGMEGKAIHITGLKGSETIGSDADGVLNLHRDYVKVKDPLKPPRDEYEQKTEVHNLKSRSKGIGAAYAELMFLGESATFVEMAYDSEPKEPDQLFGEEL